MIRAAIIQARCGSSRFPGKVFADLCGKPLIWHVVNRLHYCQRVDRIIIATTNKSQDDALIRWADENHVEAYRGDENDVLHRYYTTALKAGLGSGDIVVRVTADDPFKEPSLIDKVVEQVESGCAVFACNNNPPTYPEGLDCEVFTFDALERADKESCDSFEREHVTQYMYRHPDKFPSVNVSQTVDQSNLRFTLDTEVDYEMVKQVYNHLYQSGRIFVLSDILALFDQYPQIPQINSAVARSAMYANKKL